MRQMLKNRLKDQKGFTLIELLAVIVILGIIAAIAIPSVIGIINNSREDAIKSDAMQIINSAKLYIAGEEDIPAGKITKSQLEPQFIEPVSTFADYTVVVGADGSIKLYGVGNKDNKRYVLFSGVELSGIKALDGTGTKPEEPTIP